MTIKAWNNTKYHQITINVTKSPLKPIKSPLNQHVIKSSRWFQMVSSSKVMPQRFIAGTLSTSTSVWSYHLRIYGDLTYQNGISLNYVYIYIVVHIYKYKYIYIYIQYIHAYIHFSHNYTYNCIYIYIDIYKYVYIYIYTYMCIYIYIYTYLFSVIYHCQCVFQRNMAIEREIRWIPILIDVNPGRLNAQRRPRRRRRQVAGVGPEAPLPRQTAGGWDGQLVGAVDMKLSIAMGDTHR